MWSMHTQSSGIALIIFIIGIILLGIYIYIYSKNQKKSKLDNLEKESENKEIT
jgi:cbb3-type cytochrome oxidase subunit 3